MTHRYYRQSPHAFILERVESGRPKLNGIVKLQDIPHRVHHFVEIGSVVTVYVMPA
ncbi:hypothetical protein KZ820_14485 [Sphingomonas sp. RRHST34]|uniref:Uncharacterized protein n=1 Tax=Sphingomonas citri TaxID=2862499 RepID=A0ABS7BQS0_9SPHN|nr:hypothetical protein [Sphingomonas citri]MBW6531946.1 hypothetical protein [Sphingomonas citri]